MCQIRIGRVVKKNDNKALCDFDGVLKEASSVLFPKVKCGDDVVITSGFISDIVRDKKKVYKQVIFTDALSTQMLNKIEKYSKILKNKKISILNLSNLNDYLIDKYSLKDFLPKNIDFVSYSCDSNFFDIEHNLLLEIANEKGSISEVFVSCSNKKAIFLKNHLIENSYFDGIFIFEENLMVDSFEYENIFLVKSSITEMLKTIVLILENSLNKANNKLQIKPFEVKL